MKIKENNFAFIDGQNLYFGTKSLDWDFDYSRFRVYLKDKFNIEKAFIFIGYIESNNDLYDKLKACGYELVFKEVSKNSNGEIKGNVDVDLTLHSLIKTPEYDKAVLITSDGDFAPLVDYLKKENKFIKIITTHEKTCSKLLKKVCVGNLEYISRKERVLSRRYINEKDLPRD